MSSKSTIILTNDDEHWYKEGNEYLGSNGSRAIVMEFDKKNIRVDLNDKDSLVITLINPDSEIYKLVRDLKP